MRTPYKNDIISIILTYLRYHCRGIILQTLPRLFHWLIENLINHIWILTIFLRHLTKEVYSLSLIHIVRMPVYNDIYTFFYSRLHNRFHTLQGNLMILKIVIFNLYTHCRPHYRGMPVIS